MKAGVNMPAYLLIGPSMWIRNNWKEVCDSSGNEISRLTKAHELFHNEKVKLLQDICQYCPLISMTKCPI